jgi:hypothetical protein
MAAAPFVTHVWTGANGALISPALVVQLLLRILGRLFDE